MAAPIAAQSAANADADAAQRDRIAHERAQVERESQAAQAACASQFAVTQCIDRVKAERRQRMQALDQQRAVLDDELRKRRAAERTERVRQRQEAASDVQPNVSVRARSSPASGPDVAEPVPKGSPEAAQAARQEAASRAEAEAAQRAANAARRASEAAARRRAVEKRNQERASQRAPAAALPVPGAASKVIP